MSKRNILIGLVGFLILGWLVYFVFSGLILLPQTVNLFGLELRLYGLILGAAALGGYELARRRSELYGIPKAKIDNLAIVLIIFGVIGARLYHIFSSLDYYITNPDEIILIWQGGLSIFGAVLGGVIGVWLYQKYTSFKLPMFKILDWLVPSLVLGQIIGRFGNLFNYEAYGVPTSLPWGMFVPLEFRLETYQAVEFFHPLFLYEVLGSLLILLVLLNFSKLTVKFQWLNFNGSQFWAWVMLYGLLRIGTEGLRVDSPYFMGFKQNLMVAILMIIVAGIIFWLKRRQIQNYESKSS